MPTPREEGFCLLNFTAVFPAPRTGTLLVLLNEDGIWLLASVQFYPFQQSYGRGIVPILHVGPQTQTPKPVSPQELGNGEAVSRGLFCLGNLEA